ncbi:MAG TPA: hypothetical protein VGM12_13400 [Trebonia sp.]
MRSQSLPPKNVSAFNGPVSVAWTNPSGTEVVGSWNPQVSVTGGSEASNYEGVIGNGTVKTFPLVAGPTAAW